MYLIFEVCQYETNDFYIKNFKNLFIQYWFRRETGFEGKLVVGEETGCAENLVAQGNWFLVTFAQMFIIIRGVKQITYNAKKLVRLKLCDF